MHTVIFAHGALEAKNAQVMGHNQNFEGARSEKRANRTSQGAKRASKSDKSSSSEGRLGVKKVKILIESA